MNILLVDDDEISLEMLRLTVEGAGHRVTTARNGAEGLKILRTGEYRAVISDWEMPEVSGIDLCKAVRREALPGYVYVILLTARDATADVVTGLSAGADDFLSKPFNPAELAVRLHTAERIISMETRDVAIFAMAKLAESRDPETGAHLERVRGYSRALARELAVTPEFQSRVRAEFVKLIYQTSPLHDIGKVGIPDSILLKAGQLNNAEFEIMKSHTMLGAETLGAALKRFPGAAFLEMARDIAISHHERWNGSGYPFGVSGDEIPLPGRIVAVADVYDALTTKRVYKPSFSHERAKGMIMSDAGKHFDPDIADAFLRIEAEFMAVKDEFEEGAIAA